MMYAINLADIYICRLSNCLMAVNVMLVVVSKGLRMWLYKMGRSRTRHTRRRFASMASVNQHLCIHKFDDMIQGVPLFTQDT